MRKSGILMAVSSLPSDFGIGDFGPTSFKFADLLAKSGLEIWQILPLNPVGFGNSPYQSVCGEAIDPIYISLELLKEDGYILNDLEKFNLDTKRVEYASVRNFKGEYFKKAYQNQRKLDERRFKNFVKNNLWVEKYAQFLVLLKKNKAEWWNWEAQEKNAAYNNFDFTPYEEEIRFQEWLQFIAYNQYSKLKKYVNSLNIKIMGDIPFYVGAISSDIWANQDEFLLDRNDRPTSVGGCPPDYFSKTGQRWGNPIYDWDYMKSDGFTFWLNRIKSAAKLYDFLRIDHFRAFDTYWKIPIDLPDATIGSWEKAYGNEFLDVLKKENLKVSIIAEDLGELFPSVYELRDKFDLPGMNVFEFTAFDKNFKVMYNQVIYSGTHDNQTLIAWKKSLTKRQIIDLNNRFEKNKITGSSFNSKVIKYIFKQKCKIAIIPMQDLLGLDDYYRMNCPGTCGSPNWEFRLINYNTFEKKIPFIRKICKEYCR